MSALKVIVAMLAATSATLLYFLVHEFNPFLRRCNPDVCQSYALSAFKVHSVMHQGAGHCDYGVLPGFLSFNVMKPPGERWQTAISSCQLKNLLQPSTRMGRVRILLLGDSVDAHLAHEWCIALGQPLQFTPTGIKGAVAGFAANIKAKATSSISSINGSSTGNSSSSSSSSSGGGGLADAAECCKNRDVMYYCKPKVEEGSGRAGPGATDASISIGMFHLLGVHLSGPFHTGAKGNFLTRIPAALKAFNATFGGPPHAVVVHSNFWDQSRMWEAQQPGYGVLNKLMPDVVFSWSSNFSLLLSTTKEQLPQSSLLATRTAAFPAFSANWLGRWHYIHQLNMAATEVTRLHGLPVIDLGGMVFGLEPRQYLDDTHHPNKIVLLECANIAMNLLRQQQQRLAAEAATGNTPGSSSDVSDGSSSVEGQPGSSSSDEVEGSSSSLDVGQGDTAAGGGAEQGVQQKNSTDTVKGQKEAVG